jgi:8-oxo-dGTP pyrophosphatase MutT (NUDIX family)
MRRTLETQIVISFLYSMCCKHLNRCFVKPLLATRKSRKMLAVDWMDDMLMDDDISEEEDEEDEEEEDSDSGEELGDEVPSDPAVNYPAPPPLGDHNTHSRYQDHYSGRRPTVITSYGIIVARPRPGVGGEYELLAVCRRNTMALSEIVRGKYMVNDHEYILRLMRNMTQEELDRLGTYETFEDLWRDYWMDQSGARRDHCDSNSKFNELKSSGTLYRLLQQARPQRTEPEWSFPKGRKLDFHEKERTAAFREFEEETNYSRSDIEVVRDMPIVEKFRGTNNLSYKCVYFLAICTNTERVAAIEKPSQREETSKLGWYSPGTLRHLFGGDNCPQKMWVMRLSDEFFQHFLHDHGGAGFCDHFNQSTTNYHGDRGWNDPSRPYRHGSQDRRLVRWRTAPPAFQSGTLNKKKNKKKLSVDKESAEWRSMLQSVGGDTSPSSTSSRTTTSQESTSPPT